VRRNPVGQLFGERAEVLRAGDEVGLAVDLEEHGALHGHVRHDQPFGSRAPGLGRRRGQALLAEDLPGLFEVSLGLHERLLAVHHSSTGFGAEVGDEFGRDFHGASTS
jgi:hypothetical protein